MATLVACRRDDDLHEHEVGAEPVRHLGANRTATSAVSERSVATSTRLTMDGFSALISRILSYPV